MKFEINSESFYLSLDFTFFAEDVSLPINTAVSIKIESDGFIASTVIDTDIDALRAFSEALSSMRGALNGFAVLSEPYSNNYIEFLSAKGGHLTVKGRLENTGNRYHQELYFENEVNQSYIIDFVHELQAACECCN